MSWNYADMSKTAKQLGGPEKYADYLYQSGRMHGFSDGCSQGILMGAVGSFGSMAIMWLISKAFEKSRRKALEESIEAAKYKEKLIRAMEAKAAAELDEESYSSYNEDDINS